MTKTIYTNETYQRHCNKVKLVCRVFGWLIAVNTAAGLITAATGLFILLGLWPSGTNMNLFTAISGLFGLSVVALAVLYIQSARYRRELMTIDAYLSDLADDELTSDHLNKLMSFPVGEEMLPAGLGWNRLIDYLDNQSSDRSITSAQVQTGQFMCSYDAQKMLGLFDCLEDGILLADSMGMVLLANRACEGKLSLPLSSIVHHSVIEIFKDNHAHQILHILLDPRGLRSRHQFEITLSDQYSNSNDSPGKDGATTLCVMGRRLNTTTDNSDILLIIRDITQQKVSQAGQEDFISHVSHELRSPLTNIRAYAETLLSDMLLDAAKQKEAFNVINEETSRLIRLVNEVLDFSHMEMGSLRLDRSEVATDRLIQQCVNDLKGSAGTKQITLQTNFHPKLPGLYADREKLIVVFHNIINNAIKYTPKGGTVFVETQADDSYVTVKVSDTGIGIPKEELNKIFGKFYRVKRDETSDIPGSGLGLSTSKMIVTLHSGSIHIASELNKGTEVIVKLPITIAEPVLGAAM